MENKAMYLSTYEERDNGSMYEEAYDGRKLSKLNLCDEGEDGSDLSELRDRRLFCTDFYSSLMFVTLSLLLRLFVFTKSCQDRHYSSVISKRLFVSVPIH